MSKNLRIQGYNSKIVSADKAEREEDLKLDQSYLGFRPTVDTALIPLCNTQFIKGHKPSNHIRARIKSHVYTTEWTVHHSTYHIKRYNKMNTNVIYFINDKMSHTEYAEAWKTYMRSSRKHGATGTSTGRQTPRSPRTPGSSGWTPSRRQELSSRRVSPRGKRVE